MEDDGQAGQLGDGQRLRELAFETAPVPQITVDAKGVLVLANDRARVVLGLSYSDIGRSLRELDVSYRPVDLRSLIDDAIAHRRPVGMVMAELHRSGGDPLYYDIQVVPLLAGRDGPIGVTVVFSDVSRLKQQQDENLRARQELETYAEELQAANEELETTNEELQSTNEELETTNEELQSANEELETINEELQSTNQELGALNAELHERTDQLNRSTSFRDSILAGLGIGVAVLDRDLRVQMWNTRAADLWGLRDDEVIGQNFLNLDMGLPVGDLRQSIRLCADPQVGRQEVVVNAVDRRGRPMLCRVRCGPLVGGRRDVEGVILLMEPVEDGGSG
jgi:two-component system CheB/CheR fusion protein